MCGLALCNCIQFLYYNSISQVGVSSGRSGSSRKCDINFTETPFYKTNYLQVQIRIRNISPPSHVSAADPNLQ